MTIYRLAEHPQFAAQTAALMIHVWPQHYGAGGPGDAMADVASRIAEDRAAIAVLDDAVVGTAAIAAESFGSAGDGPWLVGLCTAPSVRGQGIATALTTWAMARARQDGQPALYTTSQSTVGIMKRLGWRRVRQLADESGSWTVWRAVLVEAGD